MRIKRKSLYAVPLLMSAALNYAMAMGNKPPQSSNSAAGSPASGSAANPGLTGNPGSPAPQPAAQTPTGTPGTNG